MTIALYCAAFVLLIPYLLAAYGGYYRKQTFGEMDNRNPRAQAAKLEGYGARLYAAQQNAWENAVVFSTAVMIASVTGVPNTQSAVPALLYIALRIAHPLVYLADWSKARSVINTSGLVCCTALIVMGATRA